MPANVITDIHDLALKENAIEVVWLYGSRAKGTHQENSDFDLAIAFDADNELLHGDADGNNYYCDEFAYRWSESSQSKISVVDINKIPVPLAASIVADGKVLVCKSDLRLHSEMQRIWSLWAIRFFD